jgi:hypothetical protein
MHPVSKRRRSAKFLSSTFEPSFSPGECRKNGPCCVDRRENAAIKVKPAHAFVAAKKSDRLLHFSF